MNGEALMEWDKERTFKEKNNCKDTEAKNEKKTSEIICVHKYIAYIMKREMNVRIMQCGNC